MRFPHPAALSFADSSDFRSPGGSRVPAHAHFPVRSPGAASQHRPGAVPPAMPENGCPDPVPGMPGGCTNPRPRPSRRLPRAASCGW